MGKKKLLPHNLIQQYEFKVMEYIISTYTHFFTAKSGEKLVYNSEMNSFFKVSNDIYRYLESLSMKKRADINTTDKDFLVENKIIVSQ